MDITQDPAILAADAVTEADHALDAAFESGSDGRSGAALAQLDMSGRAFAEAAPTTLAGARRKMNDMLRLLKACEDGDTLSLYYGAADTSIALATGSVRELLNWLHENSTAGDVGDE